MFLPTAAEFHHQPGAHCGSTALRDIALYRGWPLSESMCFGLGAGLGFAYLESCSSPPLARNAGPKEQPHQVSAAESEIAPPSRAICGRAPYLESNFFAHLEVPFTWQNTPLSENELIRWLDQDTPLLALTDLFYLPHYAPSVHFGGHAVVVAGYEQTEADGSSALHVLLADTAFPALQTIPFSALRQAMRSTAPPFPVYDQWAPAPPLAARADLGKAVRRALLTQAHSYLDPTPPPELRLLGVRQYGLAGLRAMALSLPSWAAAPDFAWCCRFAYQMIERRGTGGAAFRNLYAEFLAEAADLLPRLPFRAVASMKEAANRWSALAAIFRSLSQQSVQEPVQEPIAEAAPPALTEATRLLLDIGHLEETAMRLFLT